MSDDGCSLGAIQAAERKRQILLNLVEGEQDIELRVRIDADEANWKWLRGYIKVNGNLLVTTGPDSTRDERSRLGMCCAAGQTTRFVQILLGLIDADPLSTMSPITEPGPTSPDSLLQSPAEDYMPTEDMPTGPPGQELTAEERIRNQAAQGIFVRDARGRPPLRAPTTTHSAALRASPMDDVVLSGNNTGPSHGNADGERPQAH